MIKYRIKTLDELKATPGASVVLSPEGHTHIYLREDITYSPGMLELCGRELSIDEISEMMCCGWHIAKWMISEEETEDAAACDNIGLKRIPELPPKEDTAINPKHYKSDPSGVECIQVTRHRNFNVGNAIKYLWRQGLKDGEPSVRDLRKAIWYIEDEIKRIEGENK